MDRKLTKILGIILAAGTILFGFFEYFGNFIISAISRIIGKDLAADGTANFIVIPFTCLGVGVLVILSFWLQFRQAGHRIENLQNLARQMGWSFIRSTTLPFLKEFNEYLNDTWSANALTGSSSNVMTGRMNDRNVVVSDQVYSTGSGKSRRTYKQTLIGIELPEAQLPLMCLYPEGFMDKVLDGFMRYDIDFENRPLFSKKYVLYGRNETAIRSFFTDPILSFYEQQPPFTTVSGGKYLVIYGDSLLAPHEIMARLNFMTTLAGLFLKKS
jgi:hypothetical protein